MHITMEGKRLRHTQLHLHFSTGQQHLMNCVSRRRCERHRAPLPHSQLILGGACKSSPHASIITPPLTFYERGYASWLEATAASSFTSVLRGGFASGGGLHTKTQPPTFTLWGYPGDEVCGGTDARITPGIQHAQADHSPPGRRPRQTRDCLMGTPPQISKGSMPFTCLAMWVAAAASAVGATEVAAAATASDSDGRGALLCDSASVASSMRIPALCAAQGFSTFVELLVGALNRLPEASRLPQETTTLWLALARHVSRGMAQAQHQWMEFGVYSGYTASMMVDKLKALEARNGGPVAQLVGFDSFQGLPTAWEQGYVDFAGFKARAFARAEPPFPANKYVEWVKGWYNESLPRFLEGSAPSRKNVTLLHMDADLYSSTATAFENLESIMAPGCLIDFDELVNYPAHRKGEIRTLWELVLRSGRTIELLAGPQKTHLHVHKSWDESKAQNLFQRQNVLIRLL